jgi:hypothetical protein
MRKKRIFFFIYSEKIKNSRAVRRTNIHLREAAKSPPTEGRKDLQIAKIPLPEGSHLLHANDKTCAMVPFFRKFFIVQTLMGP